MSWLMCFGGGVFFATYILHMTTEVRLILEPALLEPYNINYPLPELLMAVGFFIVMFLEIVAMDWGKKQAKKNQQHLETTHMKPTPLSQLQHERTQNRNNRYTGMADTGGVIVDKVSAMTALSKDAASCTIPVISQPDIPQSSSGHTHGVIEHDFKDHNHLKQHQRQTLILAVALSVFFFFFFV